MRSSKTNSSCPRTGYRSLLTRRILFGSFLFLAQGALLAGCLSTSSHASPPVGANSGVERTLLQGTSATKELDLAIGMIKAGDYSQAIPRLQEIANKYPGSASADESYFHLGRAYLGLDAYSTAQTHFMAYLTRAPEGPSAADARDQLARLASTATGDTPSSAQLSEKIAEALRKAEAAPGELAPRLEVANLYWEGDYYAEAGAVYTELLEEYPSLLKDATISTRIALNADGSVTVLTPVEVLRREAERDPLVIFNTQSFRSGRNQGFARSAENDRYNVSGQVMNRSNETLSGVEVIVTIYGFGSRIFGTETVRVGRLEPNARRAFSAQFRDFDTIENVDRYEVVGTYQR